MAVIGNLRIDLGLDSAAFDRGLKNASGNLDDLGGKAKMMAAAVTAAFAGITAALTAVTTQVSSAANATGDVADRLGVPVETLQELRHAADRGGMSVQNFDVAFRRFIRRSAEAAQGTGAAKGAFEELGIQLKNNSGQLKDSETLLAEVSDALRNVQSPADRLRLAFKMFDTDGAAMVNVLAGGSGEIEKFREEARALGIVLSEDTVRAAQHFHYNLDTLRKTMEGLQNRIAAAVLPALTFITDKFVEGAQVGNAFDGVIQAIQMVMNGTARVIGVVVDNLDFLISTFRTFIGLNIALFLGGLGQTMIALARTTRTLGAVMLAVTSISRLKITAVLLLTAALAELTGTTEAVTGWIRRMGETIYEALPPEMRTGIDGLTDKLKELVGDIAGVERELSGASFNAFVAEEASKSAFSAAAKGASAATNAIGQTSEALSGFGDMGQQVTSKLASGFTDLFEAAITGSQNMMEVVGNILRDLGRMFIQSGLTPLIGGMYVLVLTR